MVTWKPKARRLLSMCANSDSHVHVKTMTGAITLTNIRDGHVEIDSVSGDVTLHSVTGPLVRVSSTSGKIQYDGDFGRAGGSD